MHWLWLHATIASFPRGLGMRLGLNTDKELKCMSCAQKVFHNNYKSVKQAEHFESNQLSVFPFSETRHSTGC